MTSALRLFERRDCFLESLAKLHGFGARACVLWRGLPDDGGNEAIAGADRTQALHRLDRDPDPENHQEQDDSRIDRLEGNVIGEREVRPRVPDHDCQQHEAQEREKCAALYESKHV